MNQAQGSQPKGSNSGLIIVIIIVVVLAILGVGGYFVWKAYGNKLFGTAASPSPSAATVAASPSAVPSPSPTASLSASKAISGDYVISDSDTRVIKEAEIRNFTPWQLKVARNEIYARHGRPFVHKDLQCYFATKSWYQVDENYSESSLSAIENKNVATIKEFEEKINSPMASKDTGC